MRGSHIQCHALILWRKTTLTSTWDRTVIQVIQINFLAWILSYTPLLNFFCGAGRNLLFKVSDNLKTGEWESVGWNFIFREAWSQTPCCRNMSRSCFSHVNISQKIKKVFDRFPSSMFDLLVAQIQRVPRVAWSYPPQICPLDQKRLNHNEAFIAISWGFHLWLLFVGSSWNIMQR